MKKLVAISVLLAGLATAVFAQNGGWSNEWKVGLTARFNTDMFYVAKETGSNDTTLAISATPSNGIYDYLESIVTTSTEYGKSGKGIIHFFPNSTPLGGVQGDNRVILTLDNSGENYAIHLNIGKDDWWKGWSMSPYDLLSAGPTEDWGFKGTAGIFDLGVGNWAVEAAWVGTNASWSSWIGWNHLNRFGVRKGPSNNTGDPVHSDHFRTMDNWGAPFAVGIKPTDNFKFTLGYRFDNWNPTVGDPKDSRASMNGSFMLSGSPVEMINFDLFYSIQGQDANTLNSEYNTAGGDALPKVAWKNIIGAYVQVNGLENLFVSAGYTAFFKVWEAGSFLGDDGDITNLQPVTYKAPVFSGVDLRLGYSGIDKIGLKFNNRVSFAGVPQGVKEKSDEYRKERTWNIDENDVQPLGENLNWVNWQSILYADLGFIDGVGLEAVLGNILGVTTREKDYFESYTDTATSVTTKTEYKGKDQDTINVFRAAVGAKYGVGNVSLGIALFFQLESTLNTTDQTVTTTASGGGANQKVTVNKTTKDITNTVKFGIPITFAVSF